MSDWHFRDLFTDEVSGRLRESKVWSNVGKGTMTWGFVYAILRGGNSEWLWTAYGSIVVLHELMGKFLNQRQQTLDKDAPK